MFDGGKLSFKRIVCPVGLSADSSQALRYAVALARSYDARLYVMYCATAAADAGVTERPGLEQFIEGFTQEYLGVHPLMPPIEWEPVIVSGEPAIEIARAAAERRADIIVMRSRRRPYAAALLGSVAESVCRMAPCPTLVTHTPEREWAGKTSNSLDLKRVLVSYDFSSDSELALSYGRSLAQQYSAELHILHVVTSRPKETRPEISMLPLASESGFSKAVAALKTAAPHTCVGGWSVRQAVREGQPYREVLAYAEEHAIELICMGASGTGFGMHALFGSNADRVLRQAPCPILIARPLKPIVTTPLRTEASAAFAGDTPEGAKR
jgi:nucleotide-binding universal stress UspA family protein